MANQFRAPSPFADMEFNSANSNIKEPISGGTQKVREHEEKNEFMFTLINKLNWKNPEPRKYLEISISKFGLPDVLAPQCGGLAIWQENSLKIRKGNSLEKTPLAKFEIKDEAVLSDIRGTSVNFCYAYVKYEVIPKCYEDVKNVDPCLNYDSQTKMLRARAKDYETCIALLMLGTAVGNCVVSASLIKKKNRIEQAIGFAYDKLDLFTKQLVTNLKNAIGTPIITERTEIPFYEE